MRSLFESLENLKRSHEIPMFETRLLSVYPELVEKIEKVKTDHEASRLWAEGEKIMKSHPPNWIEGQRIFSKLATLQPQGLFAFSLAVDFWWFGFVPSILNDN